MRRLVLRVLGFPVLTLDLEGDEPAVEVESTEDDDLEPEAMTVSATAERADEVDHPFGFWSPASDPGYVEDKTPAKRQRRAKPLH
jgi:hypothetical protein